MNNITKEKVIQWITEHKKCTEKEADEWLSNNITIEETKQEKEKTEQEGKSKISSNNIKLVKKQLKVEPIKFWIVDNGTGIRIDFGDTKQGIHYLKEKEELFKPPIVKAVLPSKKDTTINILGVEPHFQKFNKEVFDIGSSHWIEEKQILIKKYI